MRGREGINTGTTPSVAAGISPRIGTLDLGRIVLLMLMLMLLLLLLLLPPPWLLRLPLVQL